MRMRDFSAVCLSALCVLSVAPLRAAEPSAAETEPAVAAEAEAGQPQGVPQPPDGSPPVVKTIELNFDSQGGVSSVDIETYLYYMEIYNGNHFSAGTQGRWVPYTDTIDEILVEDFRRLWDTGFLDDLSIDVVDEPYGNGVIGKHITFRFEERARVKIFTFEGSDKLNRSDIESAMQENELSIRLDAFFDQGRVQQVEALLRTMFSSDGYPFAEVSHEVSALPGGPNVVQLTFNMSEGPKVHVEEIDFIGNEELSDGDLKGQMEQIKERWWLSWVTGRGTYKEALFEEDADRIVAHYLDRGYINARVGSPETVYLDLSEDGKARGMRLRIPVDEGERYRIGDVRYDGNEVLTDFGLDQIFDSIEEGEYYSQREVIEAINVAREVYGTRGYTDLTVFPDLQRRDAPDYAVGGDVPVAATDSGEVGEVGQAPGDDPYAHLQRPTHVDGDPIVDVTLRIQEGEQQFVNRITFIGNETTHDEVIRREVQLLENGVFNTGALQNSIRRLNQLGYFEPVDESSIEIENVEGAENRVNLNVRLVEANLNQVTFGAGVSQFDGVFGQLSFSTSNFLGRGEALSVGFQRGSRLRNINLGYTKPYMFNRNLSSGVNIFSRRVEFIGAYTEDSNGGSATLGWPLALFTRMFLTYSYEATSVTDVNPQLSENPDLLLGNPFFQDGLLLETQGRRTVGKIAPSVRHNTVDHPIFPSSGRSYSATMELAGLGGSTRFWKPILEGIWYIQPTSRTTIGIRTQYQHIATGSPNNLPVFERLWLGGEFSIRGFDIRRIGPTVADVNSEVDPESYQGRTIIGGNKSVLFNGEYQITIAEPVRFVFFYDTGQVQDFGSNFALDDFKTSTGIELRFFMPVLNVPFRLIYAWNPQRDGVFNDRFSPQEETVFRFAVGTTF